MTHTDAPDPDVSAAAPIGSRGRVRARATRPLARVLEIFGTGNLWIAAAAWLSAVTLAAGIGLISMAGYLLSRSALVESTAVLGLSIVGVRFFAVTRAVARYLERYVGHLGTFRVLTRVRVWFFDELEPRAPAVLQSQRRGDVLTRIVDDVATLQDFALRVVVPPIAFVMTAAIGAIVLGRLDPSLALVLIAFLLLGGVVLPLAGRRVARDSAESVVAETAALNSAAVEGVSALADLVAYGREDLLVDRLRVIAERRAAAERRLGNARGMVAGVAGALGALGALAALAIAIGSVRVGSVEPVLLAVVPLAMLATFDAVGPLAATYEHLDRSRAAAARLFELSETPPAVDEHPPPPHPTLPEGPGRIRFEKVSFSYGGTPALSDATFEVPGTSRVAILGESGAGKSTIAALLQRFWQAQHGTITLNGVDLTELPAATTRAAITVVAQHDHLFDTTVRDNLMLGVPDGDATDDRLMAACAAAGLDDTVASWPEGLLTRCGENGSRLSGGERQRLLIARALLAESQVLVLDEATAHLDPDTRNLVLSGIAAWRGERSTVHIVHELAAAGPVDVVLRVADGTVVRVDD